MLESYHRFYTIQLRNLVHERGWSEREEPGNEKTPANAEVCSVELVVDSNSYSRSGTRPTQRIAESNALSEECTTGCTTNRDDTLTTLIDVWGKLSIKARADIKRIVAIELSGSLGSE